jgi:nitrogenase molybdenum-iron protein NifN
MAQVIKRNKALAVNPLKTSAPMGAALAFLGMHRAIPMLHGSQGCTAFAKVFFVRHFREPIPLQTSAMDQVSTVMSADENVVEGLATICGKSKPALVGVPTTGLSETQGTDIVRVVKEFRAANPQFDHIPIVPVNTPDYTGCLESGYAAAVLAMVDVLVPEDDTHVGRRRRQVNVLAGASLTPGDIEHVKDLIEAFGLRPLVFPDIADSLDGHLMPDDFSPLTIGGTSVSEVRVLGEAVATLVIGRSLDGAADLLARRTGVPDHRFDHLMGLEAVDRFVDTLSRIAGRAVPERIERQRAQLQDAMVDTHFMFGFARMALAADPDLLLALAEAVHGCGAQVVAAVAPARSLVLERLPVAEVKIGDLEDLELAARAAGAELVISNSHAVETARRLDVPLLRAGFPQYDYVGGYQKLWVGYRGARQMLFDIANLLLSRGHHEIQPHRSVFSQKEHGGPSRAHDDAAPAARELAH